MVAAILGLMRWILESDRSAFGALSSCDPTPSGNPQILSMSGIEWGQEFHVPLHAPGAYEVTITSFEPTWSQPPIWITGESALVMVP